jgi:dihydroorotase
VYDLATTASKLLHLGLPLREVLRRVTATPAGCIGLADELGTLRPGAAADLTLLRLENGEYAFRDAAGKEEIGDTRLEPVNVIRAGQAYDCTPR